MPSFPLPSFPYKVNVAKEINALRKYRDSKPELKIADSHSKNLRIATWNIANFGEQLRQPPVKWDLPEMPSNKSKWNDEYTCNHSKLNDPLVANRVFVWAYKKYCKNKMGKCKPIVTVSQKGKMNICLV